MRVVVVTSDKYRNVLNGFCILFNRHWSENKEVDIVCYSPPDFMLPKNFHLVSAGEKSQSDWCTPLIPYFENMEDEYFMMCMEDHFMFKDMNFDLLDKAEIEIKKPTVAKVICNHNPRINREDPGEDYSEDFLRWNLPESHGMNRGPNSLNVAIWKKDFFLGILRTTNSTGEFESRPIPRDPRAILFPKNDYVYPQLDACRYGAFNDVILEKNYKGPQNEFVDDLDREVFEQTRRDLYDSSQIESNQFFGQWETDRIIEKYFDKDYVGVCVEVGASDGIKGSNTKYFEERGWKTLCIEANPAYKESLLRERKEVELSAIGNKSDESTEFNVFVIGKNKILSSLSGLWVDEKLVDSHKHLIHEHYTIQVPVRRLDDVLGERGYPSSIDFISIDTEGTEIDVLKSIDLEKWNVKMLVVENNHNDDDIEIYLRQFGYEKDRRYKVNDFYVRSAI